MVMGVCSELGQGTTGCSGECYFGVVYGDCMVFVTLSVIEICVDYGVVNVFHVCLDFYIV